MLEIFGCDCGGFVEIGMHVVPDDGRLGGCSLCCFVWGTVVRCGRGSASLRIRRVRNGGGVGSGRWSVLKIQVVWSSWL
jgi:hypothetical protein